MLLHGVMKQVKSMDGINKKKKKFYFFFFNLNLVYKKL
jgi:hypothetical protein